MCVLLVCACVLHLSTLYSGLAYHRSASRKLAQVKCALIQTERYETERFHWPCQGQHSSTGRCLVELLFHGLCKPPLRDGIYIWEWENEGQRKWVFKRVGVQIRPRKTPELSGKCQCAPHYSSVWLTVWLSVSVFRPQRRHYSFWRRN